MTKKIKIGIKNKGSKINLFKGENKPEIFDCALPQINLNGNRRAQIDGCTSVIEYSSEIVRLNLGKSILNIIGTDMTIGGYYDGEIVVCGKILEIKFGE